MDFTSESPIARHGQQDPSIVHSFEQHRVNISSVLRKLILKETVTNVEWQNLFYDVHMVCLWDTRGPEKLLKHLRRELNDSYMSEVKHRLKCIEDGQQLLKEYVGYWEDYKKHCDRLSLAFQQLDLATREALHKGSFHSKSNNSSVIKLQTQSMCSKYNIDTKRDTATSTSAVKPPLSPATNLSFAKTAFPYSTVRCLMLKAWADEIINPLIERLINNVQELLIKERCEFIIDSTLIVGLRESFAYLNELSIIDYQPIHMKIFEQIYVEAIGLFYSSNYNHLRKHGPVAYIEWALCKFEREEQKAIQYLEPNSNAIERVSEACKKYLIENFVEQIFYAAIQFIKTNQIENMQLIYKFFNKTDGVIERLLNDEFRGHIVSTGNVFLGNTDQAHTGNPEHFVEKLLEVYNKFDKIVNTAFSNDPRARRVFEEAIGLIINDPGVFKFTTNPSHDQSNLENNGTTKIGSTNGIAKSDTESRCAEVLANYCNYLFRKSAFSRKLTIEDLDHRLDELYLIIKLLKNKEAFIKIHKYHLMRRLILDVTINLEKEEKFINCLRDISGIPLDEINELLRMFKDLKSSDVLNTQFMKSLKQTGMNLDQSMNNNNTISNITSQMTDRLNIQENNNQSLAPINVKVLNPSAWAKNLDKCPVMLPNEITSLMPSFEIFYKNQYDGRELEWCHQLSNGVVSFKNNSGHKYDLEVTAAQLSVLCAFNDQPYEFKTLDDLKSASNLTANELRRTLWSLLSNPKLKSQIMCCVPKLESLKDLDRATNSYCINHEFVLIKNSKPQSKGRVCLIGRLQI